MGVHDGVNEDVYDGELVGEQVDVIVPVALTERICVMVAVEEIDGVLVSVRSKVAVAV